MRKWVAITVATVAVASAAWWYFRPGGPAVTPSREEFPVRGVDISAHNGAVDFTALRADSIDFVIIKASEGTDFKDPNFHDNYRRARAAGLAVGAYHFFRFDTPGYMQALNLLHSVRGKQLDLPLVIDIEEWGNPNDRATSTISSQLRVMAGLLEQEGYKVMLYSNKDGYDRFLRAGFSGYPIWIASLTGQPDMQWTFWQYTHSGSVRGVPSSVDVNTFRGSRSDFASFLHAQ